jgi:hypothetical protein
VKNIADRTIIHNHNATQIGLNLAEILDVCSVSLSAMLSVVSARKVGSLQLQPVNYRIGVFLYRGREDDEIIPFGNLCKDKSSVFAWTS